MTGDERFAEASRLVANWVDGGRIPGAVLGVLDAETGVTTRAFGLAQRLPGERPMTTDTWFDLASVTKVVFTTPRILDAASSGILDLDAPVTQVLTELRQFDPDAWQRRITLRDCLTHSSGLPATFPVYTYGTDPDQLRAFVIQRDWPHGDPVYSDLNYMLLGFVLERLADARIRDLDPGAGFAWSADPAEAAATEYCPWRRGMLVGTVHDENAAALQGAGHAGLFGTAASLLAFAGGLLDGSGATPEAIALMRTAVGPRRTYGWEHTYEGWSGGETCSDQTIGHSGFTGTGIWIDFGSGRAWTLLTNRVHPTRWSDSGIIELRRLVGDALNR
ncbi:beta-lactamase family protein [Planctomonas sp. JC2975]|uniref:serine hydrolase domain-containing protein n=1 Tax=Planctomonas sp. JC2975 TaxID=2729626 RepID=UPI001475167B|nr:serine hydrolase domain-containing protein [Planctomonas sp. JC2975]NNC13584.1 beta-lactamase family protein [Planctomonas sp. JC2975]